MRHAGNGYIRLDTSRTCNTLQFYPPAAEVLQGLLGRGRITLSVLPWFYVIVSACHRPSTDFPRCTCGRTEELPRRNVDKHSRYLFTFLSPVRTRLMKNASQTVSIKLSYITQIWFGNGVVTYKRTHAVRFWGPGCIIKIIRIFTRACNSAAYHPLPNLSHKLVCFDIFLFLSFTQKKLTSICFLSFVYMIMHSLAPDLEKFNAV